MGKALSTKTWWHWNKNMEDLWSNIWKDKYAQHTPEEEIIRINETGT